MSVIDTVMNTVCGCVPVLSPSYKLGTEIWIHINMLAW